MLTKLKIKNFKSFREEIEIPVCQNNNNIIGIIGRNASGKSTIFEAMLNVKKLLTNKINTNECYRPYKFDKDTLNQPCEYTLYWNIDQQEYEYFVQFNESTIITEFLKNGTDIFRRENHQIKLNNKDILEIPEPMHHISAFFILSITSIVSNQENDYKAVYDNINKFINNLHIYTHREMPSINTAIEKNLIDKRISELTSQADPTLLAVVSEDARQKTLNNNTEDAENIRQSIQSMQESDIWKYYECVGYHVVKDQRGVLNFEEESDGTKKLFQLSPIIFEVLDQGGYLFVDELDSAIHPGIITEVLVPLFADKKKNSKKAKLIFSMHNLGLMLYDEFIKNTTILGIDANNLSNRIVKRIAIKKRDDIDNLIRNHYGVTPIIIKDIMD